MKNNYNKYAYTLFELAQKNNSINLVSQQIDILYFLYNKIPLFRMILITKRLKNEQKISVIKNSLLDLNVMLIEFLTLIINGEQINNLLLIINKFKSLTKNHVSTNSVDIITAIELEKSTIDSITKTLFKQLDGKPKINMIVDKNIVGGVKLRFGNKIFDNSITYQINQLKKNLHNI